MFWNKTEDTTKNTVRISVESAWRRSYTSNYFSQAQSPTGETVMKINGKATPEISLGDGKTMYLEDVTITAFSEAEDWFMGIQTFEHSYLTPNNGGVPWVVKFTGCCRVGDIRPDSESSLANEAVDSDHSWAMEMDIDLMKTTISPRIVSLPTVFVKDSGSARFEIQTSGDRDEMDENGNWELETITWSTMTSPFFLDSSQFAITTAPYANKLLYMLAYATSEEGIRVPVDILVNVTNFDTPVPQFDGNTLAMFTTQHTAWPGFDFMVDIMGFQGTGTETYVGFTVGALPAGAHLSTVRGEGTSNARPAAMTLKWNPCQSQQGSGVVCMDVVNSRGEASIQKCLKTHVVPEAKPMMEIHYNGAVVANNSMTEMLYIGKHYTFDLVATDMNPQDMLEIMAVPMDDCGEGCVLIPPDSMLTDQEDSHITGSNGMMQRRSTRNLVFAPKHNHGGYVMKHCFAVRDSCGVSRGPPDSCPEACPGNADVAYQCMTVRVKRCEFVIRDGQQLQQIAAIYRTDWLQIWSHNQMIMHPDMELTPGQVIHIGHTYHVQPHDTPMDVAKRFGMDDLSFSTLNADMPMDMLDQPACQTVKECQDKGQDGSSYQFCVLPNSCMGDSGSIYQGAYANPEWFARSTDGTP